VAAPAVRVRPGRARAAAQRARAGGAVARGRVLVQRARVARARDARRQLTRVVITGASGFAGGHLADACATDGEHVVALSRSAGVDLLDADAARRAIADARPDVVYHLAAKASVGRSWEDPRRALTENVAMTLNVLEAARHEAPRARVVVVGTGEVYGPPERLPVAEDAPLHPQNPYAVSKASAELLAGFYADAHGMRVIRTRAFNHAGPRQSPIYAIASFAKQVAEGRRRGENPVRVVTGNPDVRRDFTDVRCVARAYRLLAARAPAGVYNVCSGVTPSIREIVAQLGEVAGVRVDHVIDPALVRDHEVMEVRGDRERLTYATGWEPVIPFERTLADAVSWWEKQL
jgi:GDP-4-dehydro-6-deoxy-D-mannose reductase